MRDGAMLPAESGREGVGEAQTGVNRGDRLCLQSQAGRVLHTSTYSCFRSAVPAVAGQGQLGEVQASVVG